MQILTDQEFTYRQTPATEDGTGTFDSIKGNTLVWNQLSLNGNFTNGTTGWGQGGNRSSLTASNGVGTATLINTLATTYQNVQGFELVQGHKILLSYEYKVPRLTSRVFSCENNKANNTYIITDDRNVTANVWHRATGIHTVVDGGTEPIAICYFTTSSDGYALGDQYQVKNCMCFDLTQMFGAGNEPTTVDEFTSLFPMSYYDYNAGTLISFVGTGIKTTGKNQLAKPFIYNSNSLTYADGFRILKGNYTFSFGEIVGATSWRFDVKMWDLNGNEITDDALSPDTTLYYNSSFKGYLSRTNVTDKSLALNITRDCFIRICFAMGDTSSSMVSTDAQLEFGSTATDYEPYKESTTDLPVLTYFPTGMKSAGSVYDELTPSKAITRIGAVDLGSLTWVYYSARSNFYAIIPDIAVPINANTKANAKYILGDPITWNEMLNNANGNGTYAVTQVGTEKRFYIKNTNYSSVTDFMQYVNGVYLYYELATPTEEDVEYENLTYPVDVGGTEELLPSASLNGLVDLGSLSWYYTSGGQGRFASSGISSLVKSVSTNTEVANILSTMYSSISASSVYNGERGIAIDNTGAIWVHDPAYGTDADLFKSAMSGIYLWFEKVDNTPSTTPVEANITYRGLIPVSVIIYPIGSGYVSGGERQYRYKDIVTLNAQPSSEIYRFLRYEDENGNTLSTDPVYSFVVGE